MMQTDHWCYRLGKPEASGVLKQQPGDFVVREKLGFEPSGEGEHLFIHVEKQGHNTVNLAEDLARFCQVHPKAVSYSGRKDKHAITEQWFSVHLPGKTAPDFGQYRAEGIRILAISRHHKKLRVGTHKHNQFELTLRDIDQPEAVEQRLAKLSEGVPNYFGPQRFGNHNSNLRFAQLLLDKEPIRHRQKRSMAISALRAWLFNEFVSERLTAGHFHRPLQGDIMMLRGSNSFFCVNDPGDDDIRQRLASGDILISAPMWGAGQLASADDAYQWEKSIAEHFAQIATTLAEQNLKQERRPLTLTPEQLSWRWQGHELTLEFVLPTGAFATSVVRELMQTRIGEEV